MRVQERTKTRIALKQNVIRRLSIIEILEQTTMSAESMREDIMLLYLVQHAEAKSEQEDPARGLTDRGSVDIKRVASFIAGMDIRVKKICHSGKTRAAETARVLAALIRSEEGAGPVDGLAPMDDPEKWGAVLNASNDHLMLVGHLPHLGRLSSLLLCGDRDKNLIDFRMGGIVCLKKSDSGAWSLEWMVTPEMIK